MNAKELPLPEPDSDELKSILPIAEHQRIYRFLHGRREDPPSMLEISDHLATVTGKGATQRGRRVRDLYPFFLIEKHPGREPRYILKARKVVAPDAKPIDRKTRAQVLQPQRCAMCGRTPIEDHVKLDVDHKIPQEWGGTNELDNLQPLCTECNGGKKDHFRTYDGYSEQIRHAATHEEPQRRIGELFLAFGMDVEVRSDLLEIVASAKEYQEDWQRRMRDLRFIGWDYEYRKKKEGGRFRTYYRLTKSAPWPANIIASIREEAACRGKKSSVDEELDD
ncbi:HNH endonuclease [Mycolicibacterium neoaurum]|uniref:HNH endonuclease n=1 Tax=Mycolicibacterium neoaurum TaxID=1795 RepID=UPI00248BEA7C|nr:HNH endonuclease [Mycolicibacterium neoaurum]WBP93202.1 HNH endonuclease [Mycolicibacterium neoaurum]WBS06831.1 HNH endonuclease [Mycolicibacterium neoaurum]